MPALAMAAEADSSDARPTASQAAQRARALSDGGQQGSVIVFNMGIDLPGQECAKQGESHRGRDFPPPVPMSDNA
jgi:hypothetical protein